MRAVGSVFESREVDSAEIWHRVGAGVFGEADLFVVLVEDLDVETQALEFLDEDLERLGHTRRLDLLTLDDRLVGLDSTHDVVRLDGEQLLQNVGRAVRLERPDLHLAETLAAELGLAAQRLLRDQAVRSRGPGVDLVLHEVVELEHVDEADRDRPIERLARAPVAQGDLAVLRQPGLAELISDLLFGRAVEDRRGGLEPALVESPPEVRLENLADVHSARDAEGIEDDVDGSSVGQER